MNENDLKHIKKLEAFFENSQGFMCTHDLAGKFISVNDAGANILGYTKSEILKLTLFDIVPKSHYDSLRSYLEDVENKGIASGKMLTTGKDESKRIWLYNNVLEDKIGEKPYVIGNAVDITEQHHLEEDLKHTRALLEQTNKVAKVGGWEVDLKTQKVSWTNTTKEIHAVPNDFVPALSTGINFYKEGESREKITKAIEVAIKTGKSWDLELQIINYNGDEIWVRALGNAEFVNGECRRLFGTFQDIDLRKKAELKFNESRKLLDDVLKAASEVSIIATDTTGIITVFNTGAELLLGYKADEIINKLSPAIFHDEIEIAQRSEELSHELGYQVDGFRVFIEKSVLNGSERREWTYIKKDKSRCTVSLAVTAIKSLEGIIIGYLGIATDITPMILHREELKTAKINAENASHAKSEFLANMSHEIRTPLNGIIGFTDLVLKTDLNTTQLQYISIVNQSAITLLNIINDILDFSKIEAGKLELNIEKSDIFEIAAQATDIINYQVQTKKIELLLNVQTNLPRFIWTDQVRLKQILINLLSNAAKFTEKGEIELKIESLSSDQNQTVIRFGVRDTGVGIKKEKQAKIFEAFSQEDTSTTKKYGGTGLGLTISNKLLHMVESELKLISNVGEGSLFYFDIKFRTAQETETSTVDISKIKRILVVDDNLNNRTLLKQMLQLKEIDTDLAESGEKALQMLGNNPKYDVVIIDYHMPEMDGLTTVELIRNRFKSIKELPIILLHSSADDSNLKEKCDELNIKQRMLKPVKISEIYNVISKAYSSVNENDVVNTHDLAVKNQTPVNIMMVEDNEVNAFLLSVILNQILPNVSIVEAKNGIDCLNKLDGYIPELIFMDVQMPEMNGYQATAQIRLMEQYKNVPIIALTAGNIKGERERCIEAGMNDFVVKPIVEQTILDVINKWLNIEDENDLEKSSQKKRQLNFDSLRKLCNGQRADITIIVKLIEKQFEEFLDGFKNKIQNRDLKGIHQLGHKLFGTSSIIGMDLLSEIAIEIQNIDVFSELKFELMLKKANSEIEFVLSEIKNIDL